MTWIDYTLIGIIGMSSIAGFVRGFMREALSLFTWLVALWVAWQYFRVFADYLVPWVESQPIRFGIAFIGLFLIILILGGIIGMIVGSLTDRSGFSFLDQLFGIIFGFLRGALIVLIIALLGGLTALPRESWWQESKLLTPIQQKAIQMLDLLPQDIARYFRS